MGGNTFSQVHGLRVMHYPVVLGIPALITGIYLRQLNTVFPTDVKNVTGSLEKKKIKATHSVWTAKKLTYFKKF